jgi:hypothetical protein
MDIAKKELKKRTRKFLAGQPAHAGPDYRELRICSYR